MGIKDRIGDEWCKTMDNGPRSWYGCLKKWQEWTEWLVDKLTGEWFKKNKNHWTI